MKFTIKFLASLTIIFSFFINLAFPILHWPAPIALIFLFASIIVLCIFHKTYICDFINKYFLHKNTLLTPLIIFLIYATITSIFFIIIGKLSIFRNLFTFVGAFVIQISAGIIFATYISCKEFSTKILIKITYSTIYFILLLGVFDFIICLLNITPLINAIQYFANDRSFMLGVGEGSSALARSYVGKLARIESVYIEPSTFAGVIASCLPIIYALSLSKFKIYSNAFINKFIKKTMIIITWFNIIFTQSPIYITISFIITLFIFHKQIIKHIKIISTLLFFIIFLASHIADINVSETFLQRIFTVFESVGNFDLFIEREASLATRLVNYYNTLCVWTHNPIFGVGLGNLQDYMAKQILNSHVSLTDEIIRNISNNGNFRFNTGFFYKYIAETGLIGISLLYYFLINIIIHLRKLIKYIPVCLERDFCISLAQFITIYCCLSFYDIGYLNLYIWILVGMSIGMYYSLVQKRFVISQTDKPMTKRGGF